MNFIGPGPNVRPDAVQLLVRPVENKLAHKARGVAEDLLRHNGTAQRESQGYGRFFRPSSTCYSPSVPVRFWYCRLTFTGAASRMRFRMPRS